MLLAPARTLAFDNALFIINPGKVNGSNYVFEGQKGCISVFWLTVLGLWESFLRKRKPAVWKQRWLSRGASTKRIIKHRCSSG